MRKFVLILSGVLFLMNGTIFAQVVNDSLNSEQKEYLEKLFSVIMAKQKNGDKEEQREDSIRKAVETKYRPGMASADFKFEDVNGKVVSLKDLRGKYIYIDVWATWCGPCCNEIPYLQKLEGKMHGKKITFVSVSWDRDRTAWVNMQKEKGMGGVQLHFANDESFFREFGVQFIPRFILLDKKGRVVNAYMTRPSDPSTENVLNGLKGI